MFGDYEGDGDFDPLGIGHDSEDDIFDDSEVGSWYDDPDEDEDGDDLDDEDDEEDLDW
jgi:hypothetical protein